MAVSTTKSVLFLAGGVAAAAVVAYSAGALDPLLNRAPQTVAALPGQPPADSGGAKPADAQAPAAAPASEAASPKPAPPQSAAPAADAEPADQPAAPAPAEAVVVPPSFDVVRVESGGSIVIAGKAAAGAAIELLVGSNVIGQAKAGPDGDFAVVLDDPLKPGDYQIVLRATAPDGVVAMSVETAVVSVPETPEGQVLALVEEPGKPSQMITLPKPQPPPAAAKPAEAAPPAAEAPAVAGPAAEQAPAASQQQAALPEQPQPAPATPVPAGPSVRVEAVEIDGRKVFVAGVADPGRTVRGYANQILLGDAKASPDGRFLIEAERDLPVGDYIIRVDALEPDGSKVAARAAVPFEREPGQTLAAVAAPAPPPLSLPSETAPAATAPAQHETGTAPAASVQPSQELAAQAPVPAEGTPAKTAQEAAPQGTAPAQNPAAAASEPAAQGATPPAQAQAPASQSEAPEIAEAPAVAVPAAPQATGAAPATDGAADAAAAPDSGLPVPPPAGVSEVMAPKLQAVDSAVIIRRGDSLWRISRRVYGRGVRYSTIYLANQAQIEDPDRIWPGQIFKVPEKSDDGKAEADYSTLGDRLTTVPKEGEGAAPAEAQQ